MLKQQVSVIGGGLGGLAFAQAMRLVAGYKVTVFERDKGPQLCSHGYQIGLNEQGINALKMLDLPGFKELFRENPLYGFMMADKKLDALVRFPIHDSPVHPKASLVNRWRLRDMLSTGIDIIWNKKFVSYEEKNDCVVIHFEDGTSETSALLVGADGANSKVRAQYRPDLIFEKTGITTMAGFFPLSLDRDSELPTIRRYIEKDLSRALLPHTNTLLCMRFIDTNEQENLLWSVSFNTEKGKETFGELKTDDLGSMQSELMKRMESMDCSTEISRAIKMTPLENLMLVNETTTMRPVDNAHIRPKSLEPTKFRVLLLGDAAHAMTTHAGRGANTAFCDALHLAENVLGDTTRNLHTNKWPVAHGMYEKQMWKLGTRAVKLSLENTERIHKDNNEGGITMMRYLGTCMKAWNYVTKGKFEF